MSGDRELLVKLYALFEADAPKKMAELARHRARGDLREMARVAHSLKGASATVGAALLSRTAMELELASKGLDAVLAEEKHRAVERVCALTLAALREYLGTTPSG